MLISSPSQTQPVIIKPAASGGVAVAGFARIADSYPHPVWRLKHLAAPAKTAHFG
jgi:hypothetical protein